MASGSSDAGRHSASKFPRREGRVAVVNLLRRIVPILLGCLSLTVPSHAADPLAGRIILLANQADPDSLGIARHYAEVRGVPRENIIGLTMPVDETISWAEFIATIWQPLQDELTRRKWIDAMPMAVRDEAGRRGTVIAGHRIAYLVVCRGVPLRIRNDPARYRPQSPVTDNPIFQTNQAAVDSELSLLAANDSPINGFLPNPLFRNDRPTPWQLAQVVKVARLDGPSAAEANALVDRAVEAERTGLIGRAYVDLGGVHPDGDTWLRTTARQIQELGFDLDVDERPTPIPATARCDTPALYFGWYAEAVTGPFALPGFRFPPGAIADHIHSSSAATLRSSTLGWCGPLVAHGVTATVGNVFEPYLQLVHRPDLLFQALARGDRFGDAVYFAEPVLSWQSIAIGDPLYRPFAISFDDQWRRRANLPADRAAYVVEREMRRLEIEGRDAEARTIGRDALHGHWTLPLAFALAERSEREGDGAAVRRELSGVASLTRIAPDEWALARDAAQLLARVGAPAAAETLFRQLLDDPALPSGLRDRWLQESHASGPASADSKKSATGKGRAGE